MTKKRKPKPAPIDGIDRAHVNGYGKPRSPLLPTPPPSSMLSEQNHQTAKSPNTKYKPLMEVFTSVVSYIETRTSKRPVVAATEDQSRYDYNFGQCVGESDVVFIFDDADSIHAHSFILRSASRTLSNLCNVSKRMGKVLINVHGITAVNFRIVMAYMYGYSGSIRALLTLDNVKEVSNIAAQFDLGYLFDQCTELMAGLINVENVCEIYHRFAPIEQHRKNCLQFIVRNFEAIVRTHKLPRLRHDYLQEVFNAVDQSQLRRYATQIADDILERLDMWLRFDGISLTGEERRKHLDDATVLLIPFKYMTIMEFSNTLRRYGSDFLTDEETGAIVAIITNESKPQPLSVVKGCGCGKGNAPTATEATRGIKGHLKRKTVDGLCCYDENKFVSIELKLN